MPDVPIRTGVGGLDEDLNVFLRYCKPERLQEMKRALEAGTIDTNNLQSILPDTVLRVVAYLSETDNYEKVHRSVNAEARPIIEKVKDTIDKHFGDILQHRVVLRRLPMIAKSSANPLLQSLKVVQTLVHHTVWYGNPDSLAPAVHVGFFSGTDKLLFESTMNWTDILFLAHGLTNILAGEMQSNQGLARNELLDVDPESQNWGRLKRLEESISEIRGHASTYGINLDARNGAQDADSPPPPVTDSPG